MASSSTVIGEITVYYIGNISTAFKTAVEAFITARTGYGESPFAGQELQDWMITNNYDNIIPVNLGNGERIAFYKNNF